MLNIVDIFIYLIFLYWLNNLFVKGWGFSYYCFKINVNVYL